MKSPKLRFPNFTDEWSNVQLGELLEFNNGINADRDSYGKGRKFINVLDILNNEHIIYENIKGSVEVDAKTEKNNKVEYGDLVFLRSSETREDVGKCSVYLDKEEYCLFGGFVIRGKKIAEYDPYFLKLNLETPLIRHQIGSKSGGSTRFNVSQGILNSIDIKMPSIVEQKAISKFMDIFNKKIQLQQQKIDLLQEQKKGYMQKVFKQELRFKNEEGQYYPDWKNRKIRDLFEVTRGHVLSTKEISEMGKYPVYSSQTKNNGLLGYYDEFLFENAITWTTDGANAGNVKYRSGKFYCTNVCGVLLNKEGYANKCIAEIINSIAFRYVSYVGNPKLMNNVMGDISIDFPCIEEQKKISDFLLILDNKINLEETTLKLLRNQKKGFMQKMFI